MTDPAKLAGDAGPARLFDALLAQHRLKNDAALCRMAGIGAPLLSKMRNGHLRVSADVMLRVHEVFGMPFAQQRVLLGYDRRYPLRPNGGRLAAR